MIIRFNEYNKFKDNDTTFNPDVVEKKKTWYMLDTNDILKVSENIIDLVKTAYENTEMGSFIKNENDLLKSTNWIAIDWDEYPDADATIFGRKTEHGLKIQGIGHDGEAISKDLVIKKLCNILNKDGYWIEASGALEHILYKNNVPYISSEDVAQMIFPNSDLKMIGDKGKYQRYINDKVIKETIFGKPKVD